MRVVLLLTLAAAATITLADHHHGDADESAPDDNWDMPPWMPSGCDYNMMYFEPGHTWEEGCETCTCTNYGTIECTSDTPCCLYVDESGRTARAMPGESYNDGCNRCMCGGDGPSFCTLMACPDKCSYKNWDLIDGFVAGGTDDVEVYDEISGCPKFCKCKKANKKRSAVMKCRHGEATCIYH